MYGEVKQVQEKSVPPIPDNVKHLFDKDKNFKDKLSKFKFTKMVKAGQVKGVTPSMIDDLTEFTKKDFKNNENDNEHGLNAKKVVDMFGTSVEKMKIDAINARHNMKGHISREDQRTRDSLVSKYYNKLKEEKDNPYAIGMSAAMKSTGDEPPLKKSTIKKAHDIADKIKKEDNEVSMAVGQLKTMQDNLNQLMTILQSKGSDYELEAWVQSKITSANDKMTATTDYMKNSPSVKEEVINEFTAAQIKTLEREYAPLKGRTMSGEQLRKMNGMLKKYDKSMLQKLANASIPMLTTAAKSELVINRGMNWTDFKESLKLENPADNFGNNSKGSVGGSKGNPDGEPGTPAKKKKGDDKDAIIDRLEKENQLLKVRNLEKSQKTVEPNRDTGEVPLKVGLAQKILKDMKDGKKVELPNQIKKKIKLDNKPTKIETKPTVDISPSAGGHDTESPAKDR
jgi:hypothetical protein